MTTIRYYHLVGFLFLLFGCSATAAADSTTTILEDDDDDGKRACVTLLQYKHRDCKGDPISVRNNTVWQSPGMPCKHTSRMGRNSVTNQYCSDFGDEPKFHQKVYVDNKSCHVKWYQKAYSPQKLTYSKTSCTYGYKIADCTPGECRYPSPPAASKEEELFLWGRSNNNNPQQQLRKGEAKEEDDSIQSNKKKEHVLEQVMNVMKSQNYVNH